MRKSLSVCRLLAILFSVALIGSFFLPFIGSTKEYKEYLELFGDKKAFASSDITISEMSEISLFEYTRLYFEVGEEVYGRKEAAIIYTVLLGSIGVFGILSLLWSLLKKPILLALNSILTGLALYVILWDFKDRGIMPDKQRVWGASYYIIFPLAAILLICAIWMFIAKKKSGGGGRHRGRRK